MPERTTLILGFASRVVIPIEKTQESKGAMLSRLYSIKRELVSFHSLLFTTKKKKSCINTLHSKLLKLKLRKSHSFSGGVNIFYIKKLILAAREMGI